MGIIHEGMIDLTLSVSPANRGLKPKQANGSSGTLGALSVSPANRGLKLDLDQIPFGIV